MKFPLLVRRDIIHSCEIHMHLLINSDWCFPWTWVVSSWACWLISALLNTLRGSTHPRHSGFHFCAALSSLPAPAVQCNCCPPPHLWATSAQDRASARLNQGSPSFVLQPGNSHNSEWKNTWFSYIILISQAHNPLLWSCVSNYLFGALRPLNFCL